MSVWVVTADDVTVDNDVQIDVVSIDGGDVGEDFATGKAVAGAGAVFIGVAGAVEATVVEIDVSDGGAEVCGSSDLVVVTSLAVALMVAVTETVVETALTSEPEDEAGD